jgi:hypothetical protein
VAINVKPLAAKLLTAITAVWVIALFVWGFLAYIVVSIGPSCLTVFRVRVGTIRGQTLIPRRASRAGARRAWLPARVDRLLTTS